MARFGSILVLCELQILYVGRNGLLGGDAGRRGPYNLSIQVVLLDHHCVDGLWIFEREESEASGSSGSTIAHHSTFLDLSKL